MPGMPSTLVAGSGFAVPSARYSHAGRAAGATISSPRPRAAAAGPISLVSHVPGNPTGVSNAHSLSASATDDGRFVVFTSLATNLVSGQVDTLNTDDIFLADTVTGVVTLLTHVAGFPARAGTIPAGVGDASRAYITPDGAWVLLSSPAIDLIPGQVDTNLGTDVFLYERATGALTLVSHAAGDVTATGDAPSLISFGIGMAPDGTAAVLYSRATNLIAGQVDTAGTPDGFLWESTGGLTLLSHTLAGPTMAGGGGGVSMSRNGAYATFASPSPNIVAGQTDTNGVDDLFRYTRAGGTTTLVSHIPGALTTAANGPSFSGQVSDNGNVVSFSSFATNLVPGQVDANGLQDVFVHDVSAASTRLVSHTGDEVTTPDERSFGIQLSGDGSVVAFATSGSHLIPGVVEPNPSAGFQDIYLYGRGSGTLTLVSHVAGNPMQTGNGSSNLTSPERMLSDDGRFLLWVSSSSDVVAGQTGTGTGTALVYDRTTNTSEIVSHPAGQPTRPVNGPSDPWTISALGRFATFLSFGTNVVAGQTGLQSRQAYVSDLDGPVTTTTSSSTSSTGPASSTTTSSTSTSSTSTSSTSTSSTSTSSTSVPASTTTSSSSSTSTTAPSTTSTSTSSSTTTSTTTLPASNVPGNLLDADTATIEGARGHWVPWFSSMVSRTTAQAHSGAAGLKVDVTAPHGWGVEVDNHPGFAAAAGPHIFSFWARAGASTPAAATMTVTWRDAAGNPLGADTATVALGPSWSQGGGLGVAPAGTRRVTVELSHATGSAGDTLFIDDVVVVPTTNALDADTSTLEVSAGHWIPWFSAGAGRSTAQPRSGSASLAVGITDPFGWGVQLNNHPGFPTTPGPKSVLFSTRAPSGSPRGATMTVIFRDAAARPVATTEVTADVGPGWSTATANVVAPPGTAYVDLTLSHPSGQATDILFVDDIYVVNGTVPVPPPPGPPTNLIDPATSTLEPSAGHWTPWFSTTAAQSSVDAHSGGHSLQVGITGPYGWGVTLDNAPGFIAAAGPHIISFWARTPAAGGLSATLVATWRNSAGAALSESRIDLRLDGVWRRGLGVTFAPAGTARLTVDLVGTTNRAGDSLFVDDITITSATSVLDSASATLEGGSGHWVPWFSTAADRSTDQARSGDASLKVDITGRYGWGVTLNNWPGFPAAPGPHAVGFSAISPFAVGAPVTMTVTWRGGGGLPLGTYTLDVVPNTTWTSSAAYAEAPAGTERVTVDFSNSAGGPGDTFYLDDIGVLR